MERRLAVEEYRVAVHHMPIHDVAFVDLNCLCIDVFETDHSTRFGPSRRSLNRLGARILVWSILDKSIQTIDVVGRGALRKGEIHRDLQRNTEFLYRDVGIRRNDRPRRELHALALEIVADASLLCTEALLKRFQGTPRALGRLRHARNIVIDKGRHVILEKSCPLIDRLLLGALRNLVAENSVRLYDVDELLCQIIFRTLIVVLENGGTHLRRRNRHHCTHHPIGSAPQTTEAHKIDVLITDATEQAVDVLRLQKTTDFAATNDFARGRRCEIFPFCHDATDIFVVIAMRLARTTAVFSLFAAPGDFLTGDQHGFPPILTLGSAKTFCGLLIDEELATFNTAAAENLEYHLVKLDVVDRAGQLIVTEMPRTLMIIKTAGATELAVL